MTFFSGNNFTHSRKTSNYQQKTIKTCLLHLPLIDNYGMHPRISIVSKKKNPDFLFKH